MSGVNLLRGQYFEADRQRPRTSRQDREFYVERSASMGSIFAARRAGQDSAANEHRPGRQFGCPCTKKTQQ